VGNQLPVYLKFPVGCADRYVVFSCVRAYFLFRRHFVVKAYDLK